jgi:hypothetical protein
MKKTYFSRALPPTITASADTWAMGNTSNILSINRSAQGANSNTLSVLSTPEVPFARDGKLVGIRPLRIQIQLNVGVAALTQAPTIAFYKTSLYGTSAPSATAIGGTLSGYSAATGTQTLVYDLAYLGEALFDTNTSFHTELTVNPAATTTISIYDLVLKYELVEDAQD